MFLLLLLEACLDTGEMLSLALAVLGDKLYFPLTFTADKMVGGGGWEKNKLAKLVFKSMTMQSGSEWGIIYHYTFESLGVL